MALPDRASLGMRPIAAISRCSDQMSSSSRGSCRLRSIFSASQITSRARMLRIFVPFIGLSQRGPLPPVQPRDVGGANSHSVAQARCDEES